MLTWNEKRKPYEFSASTRRYALEKANYTCEYCGSKKQLEAHHIVPIYLAIKNKQLAPAIIKHLANLQIVCRDCHEYIHATNTDEDYLLAVHDLLEKYTAAVLATIKI